MILLVSMISLSFLSSIAFADVIMPGTHPLNLCAKITNLDQFQDISLIGFITGPMIGTYQTYEIKQNDCMSKGYKFNSLAIYWVPTTYLSQVGGIDSLKTKSTEQTEPGCTTDAGAPCTTSAYVFDDPQVHLLASHVETYGGNVPDSDPRTTETIDYSLVRASDGSITLSEENGTTPMPPAPPNPSNNTTNPNPSPTPSRGFLESIYCSIISIFGGKC